MLRTYCYQLIKNPPIHVILRVLAGADFGKSGAEFGSGPHTKNKLEHPFERLLIEMQMKHKYTKPYRPQTNGKIERFWKTLKEDFTEDSLFKDREDLIEELLGYIVYYNEHRPHSSLNGPTPKQFLQKCN